MSVRTRIEYFQNSLSYRFALARSSLPRAVNRILQILTYSGTAKIYRKIRTPPARDDPALSAHRGVDIVGFEFLLNQFDRHYLGHDTYGTDFSTIHKMPALAGP